MWQLFQKWFRFAKIEQRNYVVCDTQRNFIPKRNHENHAQVPLKGTALIPVYDRDTAVASADASEKQLRGTEEHKRWCHTCFASVVGIADATVFSAALQSHFLRCKKLLLSAVALRFKTVHRTVLNCSVM